MTEHSGACTLVSPPLSQLAEPAPGNNKQSDISTDSNNKQPKLFSFTAQVHSPPHSPPPITVLDAKKSPLIIFTLFTCISYDYSFFGFKVAKVTGPSLVACAHAYLPSHHQMASRD